MAQLFLKLLLVKFFNIFQFLVMRGFGTVVGNV